MELIQKGAVLVLFSRAHVVDFDALVEMVDHGCFRNAIDVYPEEPYPGGHPVCQSKNTFKTTYLAGTVHEDFKGIDKMAVNDLEPSPKVFRRLKYRSLSQRSFAGCE